MSKSPKDLVTIQTIGNISMGLLTIVSGTATAPEGCSTVDEGKIKIFDGNAPGPTTTQYANEKNQTLSNGEAVNVSGSNWSAQNIGGAKADTDQHVMVVLKWNPSGTGDPCIDPSVRNFNRPEEGPPAEPTS